MKNHNIKILGMVVARSGSKGVPGKNIRECNGKPLVHWAAKALLESKEINHAICSTDDINVIKIVEKMGIEVPFIRPKHLSEDDSSISDVVIHALDFFQKKTINYSHVMLVQPTSPTVTGKDIDNAIELIKNTSGTNVISAYEHDDIHPSIMYREDSRNRLFPVLPESSEYQRQKFEKIYVRSGLFYLLEAKNLIKTKSLYGNKILAIKIEKERAIAIDTENDFLIAEKFMEEKNGL
jgi:CMP-N-acetylneuraminic acid synthetase